MSPNGVDGKGLADGGKDGKRKKRPDNLALLLKKIDDEGMFFDLSVGVLTLLADLTPREIKQIIRFKTNKRNLYQTAKDMHISRERLRLTLCKFCEEILKMLSRPV